MRRIPLPTLAVLVTGIVTLACVSYLPAVALAPNVCQNLPVTDTRPTDEMDFLTGTPGSDVVALGEGGDQYFAFDGDDVICGNGGDDVIAGEGYADDISGGTGSDVLVGLGGSDKLQGNPGSDTLYGYAGDDILRSGGDTDRDDLYDGVGRDTVVGTAEDVWHRCDDLDNDDHSGFTGTIVPDTDCSA